MAIKIVVGSPFDEDKQGQPEGVKPQIQISLNARKTVDGNILIYDHPEIDISIVPGRNKIITMPKNLLTDDVYEAQNKFLKYLRKMGVIIYDSVQGGNVYGTIEAQYPSDDVASEVGDPMQLLMLVVAKFLEIEKPGQEFVKAVKDDFKFDMVDPTMDKSTELGEIPQGRSKGSNRSSTVFGRGSMSYKAFE